MNSSIVLLQKWIDAFNNKDIETLKDCYAPDAEGLMVATGQSFNGLQNLLSYRSEYFKAFPDALGKIENVLCDGDWAAIEWNCGGTFKDKFFGQMPTGASFDLRGCSFFKLREGKIIFHRTYWDKLTWFSQLGIAIK